MDRKHEILNFIRDERLDIVKELQLLDILSVGQDLSLLMDNYHSLLADILNWPAWMKLVIVYLILPLINNGSFRSHNTEKSFDH